VNAINFSASQNFRKPEACYTETSVFGEIGDFEAPQEKIS